MTDRRLFLAALAAGVAGLAASANADIVANWTFDANLPGTWTSTVGTTATSTGPFAAEAGANAATSFASGVHAAAGLFTAPTGNGTAKSYGANTWAIGDYWQFTTSTTGYSGISIQWDQTSSNTGPRDFKLSYSTDGSTFTDLGGTRTVLANASPNTPWSSGSYNAAYTFTAAAPAGLDNQATVYFRLRMTSTASANGSTVAGSGSNRVDSVIISGAVPAPGAMALLGLGGLIAGRRRRS